MILAPGVFLTRTEQRCGVCAKKMPKASAARVHRDGVKCAAHHKVPPPCEHPRSSWGRCLACGSPVP